jgi:hypothetical protein
MKHMRYNLVLIFGALWLATSAVRAAGDGRNAGEGAVAESDHSHMSHDAMGPAAVDHAKMSMETTAPLSMLAVPPASGKAREAGFDGTELMEATSVDAPLAVQCAQASRGLIVVDRATWAQCTGKSAAADAPVAKPAEHPGH